MIKVSFSIFIFAASFIFLNAESFQKSADACEEENAGACYDAGRIYSAEAYKYKNYDRIEAASKVASFYKKSCELGYAQGCTAYGMSYAADKNRDTQKDALYYFRKGCDGGDQAGCSLMGLAPRAAIVPTSNIKE